MSRYVLTARCTDALGIVAAVSDFLAGRGCNIVESAQYGDQQTGSFFLRIVFQSTAAQGLPPVAGLQDGFAPVAEKFGIEYEISDLGARPRVVIAVSKFGHCLHDLLYRWRAGTLPVEIVGVFSNHDAMRGISEWYGIPYHHAPATLGKEGQERLLLELVRDSGADLVVLARYMQILSDGMCRALSGRCINIHHSFLPSFKGARPYHQAHARGVKLIGATAHYVTSDLDEGPVIEQEVERVDHSHTPEQLVAVGSDTECVVLARAVLWHAERRVLLNGQKTVVFR